MSTESALVTGAAVIAAAVTFSAMAMLLDDFAFAAGPAMAQAERPSDARLQPSLGSRDRIATLQALHTGLAEVADGSSYVWRRSDGGIAGVIRPVRSFKSEGGRICRHVIVALAVAGHSRQIEGIACRLEDGSWQLDG